MDLTEQQQLFCREVVSGKTATDAYKASHPKSLQWEKESVYVEASKLRNRPNVSQRIKELQDRATERVVKKFSKSKDDILLKLESLIETVEEGMKRKEGEEGVFKREVKVQDATREIRETLKEQAKLLDYYDTENKNPNQQIVNITLTQQQIDNRKKQLEGSNE